MIRPFLIPWQMIDREEERHSLVVELERETRTAHPMRGLAIGAIARRQDGDDVLFSLADGRVAVVHLTWSGNPGHSPFPESVIYQSLEEFELHRMTSDHAEWMKGRTESS